jgi:hypothetical protein
MILMITEQYGHLTNCEDGIQMKIRVVGFGRAVSAGAKIPIVPVENSPPPGNG